MADNRRPIKLLPGVNQTDTLTKFFAATVDHMFQPENAEFISAYIGSRPPYYDPSTDYYVGEPTRGRNNYQLPVTAFSKNLNSGKVTNIMFYDDFVNLLRFHGANTSDHSRLFNTEYYSWSPPIDCDKLLNYTKYYWVPLGPDPIRLMGKTRLMQDAVGQPTYTYDGPYRLTSTGEVKSGPLTFSTGMIVTTLDDYDADVNGRDWIINRVGTSIELLPRWPAPDPPWDMGPWDAFGWSSEELDYTKDYITIERMLLPTNQWSRNNRWFHEDVLAISGTVLADGYQQRAKRPIIEFESSLHLYDSGYIGRPPVTTVATADNVYQLSGNTMVQLDGMDISSIVGLSNVYVDGTKLNSSDTILVTGDTDATVNNRVYEIGGLDTIGGITITQVGGPPVDGEAIYSLFGDEYAGKQLYYNGYIWKQGQQKGYQSAPLFVLFDRDGIALDDVGAYPGSDFTGSTIFTYAIDATGSVDEETGLRLSRDSFGYWLYENTISTETYTYRYATTTQDIVGYYYYRNDLQAGGVQYNNGWYKAPGPSRQYIVNDYSIAKVTSQLPIDQQPDTTPGFLPGIYVSRITDGHATLLREGVDYGVSGRVLTLAVPAQPGQRIVIRSWSNMPPQGNLGYYELPLNLTANPGNEPVTTVSQSQLSMQFQQLIANQPGFEGNALGNNNWRDTPHIRGLGLSILQHRAPMPRTMILSSSNVTVGVNSVQSDTDPMLAMQYTQREYVRFYNRFITTLFKLQSNGYSLVQTPDEWVSTALKQINLGKTPASPYANSGPSATQGAYCDSKATNPTYVPPTATRLGCAPAYMPVVYLESGRMTIQCHDGARIVMAKDLDQPLGTIFGGATSTSSPNLLTDPVAAAWLQFELDLYDNLPSRYRDPQARLAMNITRYSPGKWRTGEYTRAEFIDIQRPMFDKWAITAQVDYKANTTWTLNDPFSWNYRNCLDRQGQPVPGYWQGIYRWFYDTDRPHTHPWEMLGFSQMPPWWTDEYGPAPYTSGNTYMWDDLAAGIIRQGPRAGLDPTYARPGLLSCLPVDAQGNLLPPSQSGVVAGLPSQQSAREEWIFGDGAPIESVWFYSNDYNFVIAEYSYLMKPVQFIEYNWDTLRTVEVQSGLPNAQWIYVDTYDRRPFSEFYVHRENPSTVVGNISIPNESTLTYYGSCGIQHWISEYLVSRNLSVTQYLGGIIRGTTVQLAHQMGSFVGSNLYLTADSFGQVGYTSQIVPSENVRTYLYRSSATRSTFYTGVLVTQLRDGYRVVGYDGVKQYFEVIPSNLSGPKTTVVVGKDRVVSYQKGVNFVSTVPYGTVYGSKQEVYDFLMSLQRFQSLSGFQFDQFDSDGNYIYDWAQSGKEFLFWSQGNWANGNFIALSPLAIKAVYRQRLGQVQFVSGIVGGTYPILDKSGSPIEGQNLEVLRFDDTVTINPLNNQGIYGLRLFSNTLESVIAVDNETAFNDTVYDPLFNIMQPRLKLFAYKTNEWTGRLDAPGYFLYQDGTDNQWSLVPNFEKTANDFRRYFNIDQPKSFTTVDPITGNLTLSTTDLSVVNVQSISELSKHQIGFQQRGYLQNLLLEDTTEFQFYQGFIRQKGTKGTINRLVRDTAVIPLESTFAYYEEYAFRASRFGSTAINTGIDFVIPQNQYINNPQQITVYGVQNSARPIDGVIVMVPDDPRIVVPPTSYSSEQDPLFPLRKTAEPDYMTDLPTAGYVLLGETDFYVTNAAVLSTLWATQLESTKPLKSGDTVWQFIDSKQSWTVWQYNKANVNVINTVPATYDGGPTVINCTANVRVNDGDTVVLEGISNITALNGTWTVSNVSNSGNSFTVPTYTYTVGAGGNVYVYKPVRFADETDRDNNPPSGGWANGDRAWVDQTNYGINGWTVYDYLNGTWKPMRTENLQVDASLMLQAKLYNKQSLKVYGTLEYYDPAKGFIPGIAARYIDITSINDPASYTVGDVLVNSVDPGRAWGAEKVGVTWWDLSTVRYLDYEQSDLGYRFQNWGKLAPGTTVDIYEWVSSPVDPDTWTLYATTGQSFAQFGLEYTPTGSPKTQPSNVTSVTTTVTDTSTPYTEVTSYSDIGSASTRYYFWVKNATTVPLPENRLVTTYELSNIITNPNGYGTPWYAAIDQRNILVAGVQRFLNADQTVLSMLYTHQENAQVDYKQWDLVKENDSSSIIPEYYWSRLRASLTRKDGLDNNVPDPDLSDLMRYGNLVRPRQSWFIDQNAAIEAYITKANQLLSTILLIDDPNLVDWTDYFELAEQPPADDSGAYQFTVGSISARDALIAEGLISNGQSVLVLASTDTDNLWKIYRYDYGASPVWTATRVQAYNTPNYWSYINWYLPGSNVTAAFIADYTVPDIAGRTAYDGQVGVTVRVSNAGGGRWAIYRYTDAGWQTVGVEDGTIEISSAVYDGSVNTMLFGTTPFDSVTYDIFPWRELGNIIDGLRNVVFNDPDPHLSGAGLYLNNLFFAMVNFVLNEQGFVDWIFKTSFITLKGFNVPLSTSELYKPDLASSIIDYINEAKPYHVKIRNFITQRTWTDDANVVVTDFDNPKIGATSYPSDAYLYARENDPNLIRQLKIKLVFDRVVSAIYGWDSFPWEARAWDFENLTYATIPPFTSGAFDRIQAYYEPGPDMIRKDDPNLIPGSDYRGIIIDGIGLRFNEGWDNQPWDLPVGWDAGQYAFDEYLDVILQGGVVPQYDAFFGTGTRKMWKLSRVAQDPALVVVWSDSILRDYGVDWIIPNWVNSLDVISGGTGYAVGDQLELDLAPSVSPTKITVAAVDGSGGITAITLDTKGEYDLWQGGPQGVVYQPYAVGSGTGAMLMPTWGGDTLIFNEAPSPNSVPNIFVLFAGTTFLPAPTGPNDFITDGYRFVQPNVAEDHPEERYPVALPESVRIDTYTQAMGGSPIVYMRIYQLNGVQDHFDLGITPMDTASVIAQIDGTTLTYGLANDYVINWTTNQLVFIVPPTGQSLQILTIGTGGTGTGIYMPSVVEPGQGYQGGDVITLAGGMPINYDAATVQVTKVSASVLTVAAQGNSYAIGDTFVLQDDIYASGEFKTEITVDGVNEWGNITSASISQPGSYTYHPLTQSWMQSGTGTGAVLNVDWGVQEVVRANQGTYVEQPAPPISQASTSGTGTGATFDTLYTSVLGQNTYTGDGNQSQFTIDVPPANDDLNNMLITLDGVRLLNGIGGVVLGVFDTTVTVAPAPPLGSVLTMTVFSSNDFSFVADNTLLGQTGLYVYPITLPPYSTKPPYLSVTFTFNGIDVSPPPMQMFEGTGYTTSFVFDRMPANPSYLQFFAASQLLTYGVDYTVIGNAVVMYTAPPAGRVLAAVNIDPGYGYNYIIVGNALVFNTSLPAGWGDSNWTNYWVFPPGQYAPMDGDVMHVITYSEDISYGFQVQQFNGPCYPNVPGNQPGTYVLTGDPVSDSSLMVWVNTEMQTLLYDYRLEVVDSISGWDTTPWDLYGWGAEYSGEYALVFGDNVAHTASDFVSVQYMTGQQERPATAFRLLSDGNAVVTSTAINGQRTTLTLAPVLVHSDSIEVADITVLTAPTTTTPGAVWIDDERIVFWTMRAAPTVGMPNRGFLETLQRGTLCTPSGNVSTLYNTIFYNGDGSNVYFPAASGTLPAGGDEVVFVGNIVQISNEVSSQLGTYSSVDNPVGQPAGRYIVFNDPPQVGWRNVKIAAPNAEAAVDSNLSHRTGSTVIDAGTRVTIPGGYRWEASPQGLQQSDSALARFLLANADTRS